MLSNRGALRLDVFASGAPFLMQTPFFPLRWRRCAVLACLLHMPFVAWSAEALGNFVLIKGGTFYRGAPVAGRQRVQLRVDDFEMLDHPVTNAEYRRFVTETAVSGAPALDQRTDPRRERG